MRIMRKPIKKKVHFASLQSCKIECNLVTNKQTGSVDKESTQNCSQGQKQKQTERTERERLR